MNKQKKEAFTDQQEDKIQSLMGQKCRLFLCMDCHRLLCSTTEEIIARLIEGSFLRQCLYYLHCRTCYLFWVNTVTSLQPIQFIYNVLYGVGVRKLIAYMASQQLK